MIIYKPTDKVDVQIGDVTLTICPLSRGQRIKLLAAMDESAKGGFSQKGNLEIAYETIKMSVKGINAPGYQTADGSEISMQLDDSGALSEESLELLLALLGTQKLAVLAGSMLSETISQWNIPGVEIIGLAKDTQEKKAHN